MYPNLFPRFFIFSLTVSSPISPSSTFSVAVGGVELLAVGGSDGDDGIAFSEVHQGDALGGASSEA